MDGALEHVNLSKFAYLNVVVRETLRPLPSIGNGMMYRTTPTEGLMIDGTFIPGNANVGMGPSNYSVTPDVSGDPTDLSLSDGSEKDQNLLIEALFSYFLMVLTHVWESTLRTLSSVMLRQP